MTNIFLYKNNFIKYENIKSVLQYGRESSCVAPQISVVMPVWGNPKYFIHSFNSVIYQDTDLPYEVVVVDNTPLDQNKSEILKLIEKTNCPKVFYYRNEKNIGMAGNWNRGIELARAAIITFCHDDDMLFPKCLSTLWEIHNNYPGKWILPRFRIIDENVRYPFSDTNPIKLSGKECIPFGKIDIFMGNPTNGVGCLFYKKHLLELGGYNEEYYPSMDNALHINYVFKYGAIQYLQKLYCYRITNNNASNSVYEKFISNGLFYCECMTPRLNLPPFVTNHLKHAYRTNVTIQMESVWSKEKQPSISPSNCDKIVNKFLLILKRLKTIGFYGN